MHLKLKRTPGIYLAGFMGSGKSTVGLILADRLGWEFVDVDREIEATQGTTIGDIFDSRGEAEFRRIEAETLAAHLKQIECGRPQVVALGGGAFVQEENFSRINNCGISVWIDCPFETIEARIAEEGLDRPNARDPQKLRTLYESRREGYARADFRVDGSLAPEGVAETIVALPLWK